MLQHFQARKPSTINDKKDKVVSASKRALLAITQPQPLKPQAEPEPTAPEPVTEPVIQSELEPQSQPEPVTEPEPQPEPTPAKSPAKSPPASPAKSPAAKSLQPPASPPKSKALPKPVRRLPLPANYKALGKVFEAIDTIYSFRDSRQEVFIFDKVKKSIENTCQMTINRDTLGQIRSVYPEAFDFKAVPFHENESKLQSSILLTIKHTLPSDGRHPMLLRKEEFQRRLEDLVIAEHSKFLATLPNPPLIEVSELQHWHPDFKLDNLPPIPVAELPELPKLTTTSALQLLKSAQARNLSPRVRSAFQEIADKASLSSSTSSSSSSLEPSSISSPSSTTSLSSSASSSQVLLSSTPLSPAKPATKGTKKSAELLARVRAKEQHRLESLMRGETREQQERSLKISRLPRIIDVIHYLYSSSGRTAMFLDNIVAKLIENVHTSSDDMKGHLKLLTEVVPEWCSLIRVTDGIVFKISKDVTVPAVKRKIQELSQQAAQ